jgi:hypothetical protein
VIAKNVDAKQKAHFRVKQAKIRYEIHKKIFDPIVGYYHVDCHIWLSRSDCQTQSPTA